MLVNITIYSRIEDSCINVVCELGVERNLKITCDRSLSLFFTFSPVFMFFKKMRIKKRQQIEYTVNVL